MFWAKKTPVSSRELAYCLNEVSQFVSDVCNFASQELKGTPSQSNWVFLENASQFNAKATLSFACAEEMALILKKRHGRRSFDDADFVVEAVHNINLGYFLSIDQLDERVIAEMLQDGSKIFDCGLDLNFDVGPSEKDRAALKSLIDLGLITYEMFRKDKLGTRFVGSCQGAFHETFLRAEDGLGPKKAALEAASSSMRYFADDLRAAV